MEISHLIQPLKPKFIPCKRCRKVDIIVMNIERDITETEIPVKNQNTTTVITTGRSNGISNNTSTQGMLQDNDIKLIVWISTAIVLFGWLICSVLVYIVKNTQVCMQNQQDSDTYASTITLGVGVTSNDNDNHVYSSSNIYFNVIDDNIGND